VEFLISDYAIYQELDGRLRRTRRMLPDCLSEKQTAAFAFPACEGARIDCKKPDVSKIDLSQPIKSWRTAWRRALKDAKLDIGFHDLRHTCITKLAEGRASEQTLMSIAGHLSRKMLEHYSHIRMAAKRTAVDGLVLPAFDGGVAQNGAQSEGARIVAASNLL
jgi:integrase